MRERMLDIRSVGVVALPCRGVHFGKMTGCETLALKAEHDYVADLNDVQTTELAERTAVLAERMKTMQSEYKTDIARLAEDMAKRDAEMAKRHKDNIKWLVGLWIASVVFISVVVRWPGGRRHCSPPFSGRSLPQSTE